MRLAQLQRPLAAAASGLSGRLPIASVVAPLQAQWRVGLDHLGLGARLGNGNGAIVEGRRGAKVKAQGHYKLKPKKTHPKKLGAKRTGGQYVLPGSIIFKQHGTHWFPGENAILGRDFTIHAAITGYVRYYRDPRRHPDRKYIGVVYDKDDKLPSELGSERKRRLGRVPVPLARPASSSSVEEEGNGEEKSGLSPSGIPSRIVRIDPSRPHLPPQVLGLTKNYAYKEGNRDIGRLATTMKLRLHKFPSRKAYFRNRRRTRDRDLSRWHAGQARMKAKAASAATGGVKMGKKDKKDKKEKKTMEKAAQ